MGGEGIMADAMYFRQLMVFTVLSFTSGRWSTESNKVQMPNVKGFDNNTLTNNLSIAVPLCLICIAIWSVFARLFLSTPRSPYALLRTSLCTPLL